MQEDPKGLDLSMLCRARFWLSFVALLVSLNILFLLLLFATQLVPQERIREVTREAFSTGELDPETDFPSSYHRDVFNHYNDCLILQMLSNEDSNALFRAVGPRVSWQTEGTTMCGTVYRLAQIDTAQEDFEFLRYTRYWHGHNVSTAILLSFLDLGTTRIVLEYADYASLLLLLLASWTTRRAIVPSTCIVVAGLLFWAIRSYGSSLSHGPGDVTVILPLAAIVYWWPWLSRMDRLVWFCTAYGSVLVFMEFTIGLLPMAAGFLFALSYLLASAEETDTTRKRHAWSAAIVSVAFLATGALVVILVKQGLAIAVLGSDAYFEFMNKLAVHMDTFSGRPSHMMSFLITPIEILFEWKFILTYGNELLGKALLASAGLSWLTAAVIVAVRRDRQRFSNMAALIVAAMSVVAWVALLPNHTSVHGAFMVRILIVPIALGWTAFALQLVPQDWVFKPKRRPIS